MRGKKRLQTEPEFGMKRLDMGTFGDPSSRYSLHQYFSPLTRAVTAQYERKAHG